MISHSIIMDLGLVWTASFAGFTGLLKFCKIETFYAQKEHAHMQTFYSVTLTLYVLTSQKLNLITM